MTELPKLDQELTSFLIEALSAAQSRFTDLATSALDYQCRPEETAYWNAWAKVHYEKAHKCRKLVDKLRGSLAGKTPAGS